MLEAQPVGDVRGATTYTVTKGDSLSKIAKNHGVSVAEIAAANNIRRNAVIRLGQKLIIPAKTVMVASSPVEPVPSFSVPQNPAPVASRGSEPQVKHVVRLGETLGAIARKYQVKVGEIATANNIADPAKIRPGQELVIPGWQAPKERSTAPAAPAPAERSPVEPASAAEASVPSLVIPAPEANTSNEPPVIRVEENP
jgi:LysM repeat protein